jgi:hypothetical protein
MFVSGVAVKPQFHFSSTGDRYYTDIEKECKPVLGLMIIEG